MQRRDKIDAFGASLLVGFSTLLGLNQALVKFVNAGLAPLFQAGLRSACAAVVLMLWMLARGKRFDFRNDTLALGIFNGCLFATEFALLFLALDQSTVVRVSLLFYTMPFFTALGSHFLFPGERLTMLRLAGLALAIAGVSLVMQADGDAAAQATWIGDVLALGAAMCWAGITLLTRGSRLEKLSPEQNLLYLLLVSAPLLLAATPLFGDSVRTVTATIWAIFGFQVIAIASFGFLLWTWILSIYPVSSMASFSLLTPLFGVFFGWLIFDEQLTVRFLSALGLVCSGLLLINRTPKLTLKSSAKSEQRRSGSK